MCQIFIKLQSYEKTFEMNVFLIVYLVYLAFHPCFVSSSFFVNFFGTKFQCRQGCSHKSACLVMGVVTPILKPGCSCQIFVRIYLYISSFTILRLARLPSMPRSLCLSFRRKHIALSTTSITCSGRCFFDYPPIS